MGRTAVRAVGAGLARKLPPSVEMRTFRTRKEPKHGNQKSMPTYRQLPADRSFNFISFRHAPAGGRHGLSPVVSQFESAKRAAIVL